MILIFGQCSDTNRLRFETYEVNPFKNAFVKNEISSYLVYYKEKGKVEIMDSVSVDENGNIKSIISKGWGYSEIFFSYDSLGRLISESFNSDINGSVTTNYEIYPDRRIVIMNLFQSNQPDTSHRIFLVYDPDLKRILKQTEVSKDDLDTVTIDYNYDLNRIVSEVKRVNDVRFVKDYIYEKNSLIQVKQQHDNYHYSIDYVSKESGLRDSTVKDKMSNKTVYYYKYYKRSANP